MRPGPLKIALLSVLGIMAAVFVGWKIVVALRSDETRVRLVLEDVERLARAKDGGGVNEYLDPSFSHPGGLDYVSVKRLVIYYFHQAKNVEAEIEPVSPVEVQGDVATVTVRARVSVKLQGQLVGLGDTGLKGDTFVVTLKRHESYFRCTGVREATEDDTVGPGAGGEAGAE